MKEFSHRLGKARTLQGECSVDSERNADRNGDAQEVSETNKGSIRNGTASHSCYFLTSHVATFYLCPKI